MVMVVNSTSAHGYTICFSEEPKTAYVYDFTVNYGWSLKRWKYCPFCGEELKAEWNYCPNCGVAIRFDWAIKWEGFGGEGKDEGMDGR